jgi:hypothetical protein
MVVIDISPLAHPMWMSVGRRCGVDRGPQVRAAGIGVVVVVVGEEVVVVDRPDVVVVATTTVDVVVGGEDVGPRVNPIASPMPRAARTAIPTRTTVLRRRVITLRSTMKNNGTCGTCLDRGFGSPPDVAAGGDCAKPGDRNFSAL